MKRWKTVFIAGSCLCLLLGASFPLMAANEAGVDLPPVHSPVILPPPSEPTPMFPQGRKWEPATLRGETLSPEATPVPPGATPVPLETQPVPVKSSSETDPETGRVSTVNIVGPSLSLEPLEDLLAPLRTGRNR